MIKKIIGGLLIVIGIGLGLYLGLWVCFIGGIMGIATAIDNHTVTVSIIAWNSIKILFSGLIGVISFYIPSGVGMLLCVSD